MLQVEKVRVTDSEGVFINNSENRMKMLRIAEGGETETDR
jgi:hypothetical protein